MNNIEIVKETEFGIVINPTGQVKADDCMYAESKKREIEKSYDYGHRYMNFQELKDYYMSKIEELQKEVIKLVNENVILTEKCESYENHIAMLDVIIKGE